MLLLAEFAQRRAGVIQNRRIQIRLLRELPDGAYRLTPYDPAFEKKMKKAEEIVGRYRNTLRALSK